MDQHPCPACNLMVFDKPVCPKCERPVPPVPREGHYVEDYGGKEAVARHMAMGLCACTRCMLCWNLLHQHEPCPKEIERQEIAGERFPGPGAPLGPPPWP